MTRLPNGKPPPKISIQKGKQASKRIIYEKTLHMNQIKQYN